MKWLFFKLAHFYARVYGFFCYYRKKERRKEIGDKFDFFLKRDWRQSERKRIVRHIFELRGSRKMMHYLIPLIDRRLINRFYEIQGLDHVDRILKEGRGVLVVAGHLGNPHLAFCAIRRMGYDLTLVKSGVPRKAGHGKLRYRETPEDTIFIDASNPGGDYKGRMLEILRSGKIIQYYEDTREGRVKEKVPFMGREMEFPTGMIHLARQAGAAVVPCIHYYRKGKITILFKEPLDRHWAEGAGDYRRIVSAFAELLETTIRANPEQYMGIYGPTVLSEYYRSHRDEKGPGRS